MTDEEIRLKLEQLEKMMKQNRYKKSKRSSRASTNEEESDKETFYVASCERRERRSQKTRHKEKFYKHNVKFSKFGGDSDPDAYGDWKEK